MASAKTPAARLVAVDDGYAATKIFCPPGEGTPDGVRTIIPTSVRAGHNGVSSLDGAKSGWYESAGQRFTVSADIAGEDTAFGSFHGSDLNRVMVAHALRIVGFGGAKVRLVCGLPVGDYFKGAERNQPLIDAKAASLMRGVTMMSGEPLAELVSVQVVAQGVAAFIDHVVDPQLNFKPEYGDARIAVVDVGGRTTDVAVIVDGGTGIDHSRSGSENIGMLDVYRRLEQVLQRRFDFAEPMPLKLYASAVRDGVFRIWGKTEDVREEVKLVREEVEARLLRVVNGFLGDAAAVDQLLLVGGGANFFKSLAGRYRHGLVPDDPECANARGMYKMGLIKEIKDAQGGN